MFGYLQVFDIETGFDTTLLNLNPEGWIEGVTTERSWKMLYGMDVCTQRQVRALSSCCWRAEECFRVACSCSARCHAVLQR